MPSMGLLAAFGRLSAEADTARVHPGCGPLHLWQDCVIPRCHSPPCRPSHRLQGRQLSALEDHKRHGSSEVSSTATLSIPCSPSYSRNRLSRAFRSGTTHADSQLPVAFDAVTCQSSPAPEPGSASISKRAASLVRQGTELRSSLSRNGGQSPTGERGTSDRPASPREAPGGSGGSHNLTLPPREAPGGPGGSQRDSHGSAGGASVILSALRECNVRSSQQRLVARAQVESSAAPPAAAQLACSHPRAVRRANSFPKKIRQTSTASALQTSTAPRACDECACRVELQQLSGLRPIASLLPPASVALGSSTANAPDAAQSSRGADAAFTYLHQARKLTPRSGAQLHTPATSY
jgi:hypothetical protein